MPYYRITIHLRGEAKPLVGIRESTMQSIDTAWLYYRKRAEIAYPGTKIRGFEVVMLSRHSPEVARFLAKPKRPPTDGV